ncbi:hypothetical protein M011DRAFT_496801 [Sporormia fimetaria CBS 119925]|uniref:HNH domain-containing protein n=1 Tax=Sporormia fimetaria CBS 119925 TaxID=1340428 RepID=A0A6A6UZI8_9PLEO|nr:hypothetical protein M011DRAFT_496801 [Sporormia fimetaria CBS 119925]
MFESVPEEEQGNYETFRECLSEPVLRLLATPIEKPTKKKRKSRRSSMKPRPVKEVANRENETEETSNDAEDLSEFIEYLSSLIFPSLPSSLRTLSYAKYKDSPTLQDLYTPPLTSPASLSLISSISPPALDSLSSYSLLPSSPDPLDLHNFFTPVLTSYITATTAPPPIWISTRTTECELCHRDWIPLTYHHLIPKSTHERVLKRGWHTEDRLNSVAWLCRSCHSFVHRLSGNEELAREWYTIELLEQREDVQVWVKWIGRVRWKKR